MKGLLSLVFQRIALPACFWKCGVRTSAPKIPSPLPVLNVAEGKGEGRACPEQGEGVGVSTTLPPPKRWWIFNLLYPPKGGVGREFGLRSYAPYFLVIVIALLTLGAAPLALLEDSILLKGPGIEIRAKVTDLKPDHVTAIVSKEGVTSINYSMEDKEGYFDRVSFGSGEVSCKIVDMGESTMVLEIPREEIASVRVFFQKEQGGGRPHKVDESPSGSSDSATMPSTGPASLEELKEELKRELKEEITTEKKAEEKVAIAQSTGRVEGKITRGGNPLPGCKVKIVLMAKKGGFAFFKSYSTQEDAPEFETETDREGRYVFQEIPAGDYKLYWRPPWENSWIRRMKMEPDVFVQAGKTCNPKDVDTGRPTVN